VATLKERLSTLEKQKSDGIKIRSRIKWKEKGDWGTGDFFNLVRDKPKTTLITKLRDNQGRLVTEGPDLHAICEQYYTNLYEEPTIAPRGTEMQQILSLAPDRFFVSMNATLGRLLTSQELLAAANKIAKDRSLGPDGINIFFYIKFWNLIGKEFKDMFGQAIINGRLPPGMTRGLITLIHKKGELKDLGNWRPITLFNTSCKILAKALQLRLQPMLSEVVDPDQTAFISMKYILDNVLVTHETIDHARRSNQDLIFLKLDYRKAFDRIDWRFLFACLESFGIDQNFIDLVKLLFTVASAAISINKSQTNCFNLRRKVRQDCPLAPYLSILVQEILNTMVKKAEENKRIRGTRLPGSNLTQLISQFADDTSSGLSRGRFQTDGRPNVRMVGRWPRGRS
jgi:hypothetical protein